MASQRLVRQISAGHPAEISTMHMIPVNVTVGHVLSAEKHAVPDVPRSGKLPTAHLATGLGGRRGQHSAEDAKQSAGDGEISGLVRQLIQ
jgi:hypothetical protein